MVNGSGTLDGVTVEGMLDVGSSYNEASLTVTNGLTLDGTMLVGNSANNNIRGAGSFTGSQTLGGSGTVEFGMHPWNAMLVADGGTTLTIGSGITIHGQYGTIGYWAGYPYYSPGNVGVINLGTISADDGGTITVTADPFVNQGVAQAINGGTLTLDDNWSSSGSLAANGGTLNLNGTWSNGGSLDVRNDGVANWSGTVEGGQLGTFSGTNGTVNVSGVVNNTGTNIVVDGRYFSLTLNGGTILGGVVMLTNGASLMVNGSGTLDGVTVEGMLDVGSSYNEASLTVTNGLTLDGTMLVGNSANNNIRGAGSFTGSQTLGGSGTVEFGMHPWNAMLVADGGTTLTIGSGITIHGQYGTIGYWAGYPYYSPGNVGVVNLGTISADFSSGIIWVTGYPFLSQGVLQAINGGTLNLNGAWSNAGVLDVRNGGVVNWNGTVTGGQLGTFSGTNGTVNLVGTMNDAGAKVTIDGRYFSLVLNGGTIVGGVVTLTNGASLIVQNGTLDGVAVNGELNVGNFDGGATLNVTNGLTLNGVMEVGSMNNYWWDGYVNFYGSQTLGGNGSVVFGYAPSSRMQMVLDGTVLTLGAGIEVHGQNGYVGSGDRNCSLVNQGTIVSDGGGTITIESYPVVNQGNIQTAGGLVILNGTVEINDPGRLTTHSSDLITVSGSLLGNTRDAAYYSPLGTLELNGSGTANNPQLIEAMSQDVGNVSAGFNNNFAYGTIELANNTYVELVNQSQNSAGTHAEALYVDSLIIPSGCTLNLNGLNLYARLVQLGGTVTGGSVSQAPDSGPITVGNSTPGSISQAGQLDEWTFFGYAGHSATVIVNPGSSGSPAAPSPYLGYVNVVLLDPNTNVIAAVTNSSYGQIAAITDVALPVDGTYRIEIRASPQQPASTGNYMVTVWDVTANVAPLLVNQRANGTIQNPYSVDQWTFSASANEQVQFILLNASSPNIAFSLTGPNGWGGFTNLTASSEPITLPDSGTYAITAIGTGGQYGGDYAFQLEDVTPTTVAAGTNFQGQLVGSGQAQLFQINLTQSGPAQINLLQSLAGGQVQIYAKYGSPPTPSDYDYEFEGEASQLQQLLIPFANQGSWYILVYAIYVPQTIAYSFSVQDQGIILSGVTPALASTSADAVLTLAGAGFDSGTTVVLIASNNTVYAASSVEVDSYEQIKATFAAGTVPAGLYSVQASSSDAGSAVITNALTIAAAGQPKLVTDLVVPGVVGYHEASTIYVEYSNLGQAAMPAPLLLLTATQDGTNHLALMTLNASIVNQGFWTSAQPLGFTHSIQILASGATAGVLQPGESFRVPVYYCGWQQDPAIYGSALYGWDPSHPPITFNLGVLTADNTNSVDWASLQDGMQPSTLTTQQWNAVWGSYTNQVGSTWGNYVSSLDNNASYLGRLGLNVVDVGSLLQFELLQADGVGPLSTLSSVVDATVDAPGFPLGFSRVFPASISQRNQLGPLGYGWSHNWQLSLTNASDGTVTIFGPAGSQRVFQPDSRGNDYFSQPGDRGTLISLGGGVFQLTEVSGIAYLFNADGTLNYVADPNGNRITAGYTGGLLTSLTHSSGQYLQIGYDGNGRIHTVTDSMNRQAVFFYDAAGEHLKVSQDYAGRYTTNSYVTDQGITGENALQAIAYPGGSHQYYSFDSSGRLSAAWRDGNAEPVWFGYDLGEVMVTNGVSKVTTYYFDNNNLLMRMADPLGDADYLSRDNQFDLSSTTDPAGRFYNYGYDTWGNVTSYSDPFRNVTRFAYTAGLNRLATLQDANANTTDYGYNQNGNLQSITYADNTVENMGYDSFGNTLVWKNRRGQAIYYTNDVSGRLIAKLYPSGKLITYGYDFHGNLTNATTADPVLLETNIIQMAYDVRDELTNIVYPKNRWLAFTYYDSGQRASMQDQLGNYTGYHYDAAGRLQFLTDATNGEIIQYYYDAAGRLNGKLTANGNYCTNIFDDAGQLLHLINCKNDGTVNSRFDYTYDSRGRRKTMQTLDGNWTYGYDDLGQLTNAVFASINPAIANQDWTYNYDAVGNRLNTISNGVMTVYAPNGLNQYNSVGNTTNYYDSDGNLRIEISPSGTNTYTFDEENRLIAVTTPTGSWQYEYDAFGKRIAAVVNGQLTEFQIDPAGLGNVVNDFDSTGSLVATYTYGFGLVSCAGGVTGPAFYDVDAMGSSCGISGLDGTYQNKYAYMPFGETVAIKSEITNRFEFIGQCGVANEGNGLFLMAARFYKPSVGCFTANDPIGLLSGEMNLRRYAHNNPIANSDSSGLASVTRKAISGAWGGLPGIGWPFVPYTEAVHEQITFSKPMDIYYLDENGGLVHYGGGAVDNIGYGPNGPFSYRHNVPAEQADFNSLVPRGDVLDDQLMAQAVENVLSQGVKPYSWWEAGQYYDNCQSFVARVVQEYSELLDMQDTEVATSQDPNNKICPAGYGTNGWIRVGSLMPYEIMFENATNATAPAQQVVVTDPLSTNLNWSTFELTDIGFGDNLISVPPHSQYFKTTVPMTYNGVSFEVDIEAGIDFSTGQVYANFYSINPLTGLPPDVTIGFLPPEDGTGRGQGHVSYTIYSKTNLVTGTIIRNVAYISFDDQTVIRTDQINPDDPSAGYNLSEGVNTIDATTPSSRVQALPGIEASATFTVRWSGTDGTNGPGIQGYTIFISTNGAPFGVWLSDTTNTSAVFNGQSGQTYEFYSEAQDNAGNIEPAHSTPDATTTVGGVEITSCGVQTNGAVSITFTSLPGTTNVIVSSTNLYNWLPIGYIINTNQALQFLDSNSNRYPTRFYRVYISTNSVLPVIISQP
jgi:RHS repeat-associated protein